MRLLMITRKVDQTDSLAGFAFDWVKKIAEKVDKLDVICLEKGDVLGLPKNVRVFALGENRNRSEENFLVRKLKDFFIFQKMAFHLAKKADGIFSHMNPEYVISIAPAAKIFNKQILMWYAHGSVSRRLRLAANLANKIFSPNERSFRLENKKVEFTGHGIDIDKFKPEEKMWQGEENKKFKILTVGRISPTKDYESLIKAVDILAKEHNIKNIEVNIIGGPGLLTQGAYSESLKAMVSKMELENAIHFLGPIANNKIVSYYQKHKLFINLSKTGSVDKAVLEAMASGSLVLTSNEAFKKILAEKFLTAPDNPKMLAEKILALINLADKKGESESLQKIVIQNHNLNNLITKIINFKT